MMTFPNIRRTYKQKCEILDSLSLFSSNVKAALFWKTTETSIRDWKKNAVKIRAQAEKNGKLKSISMGTGMNQIIREDMVEPLRNFITKRRDEKKVCSTKAVAGKVVQLRHELALMNQKNIYEAAYTFMKRHGFIIRRRTTSANLPSNYIEKRDEFLQNIQNMSALNHYNPDFIINFDQTSFYKDYEGNTTIDVLGAKTVTALNSNESGGFRTSVCLAVTASGKKLQLFVIFKGKAGVEYHVKDMAMKLNP